MLETLFNKFFKKDTSTQFSSCKYCEIFKNSFFIELPWWLLQTTFTESPTLNIWLGSGHAFVGGNPSFSLIDDFLNALIKDNLMGKTFLALLLLFKKYLFEKTLT